MAGQPAPRDVGAIEEVTVSNMWDIAGLVEVLERKGILTRQEINDAIVELRKRYPETPTPP